MKLCAAITGLSAWQSLCWSTPAGPGSGRREALAGLLVGASLAEKAEAYPNAQKKVNRAFNDLKVAGPQPGDLGLQDRPWLREIGWTEDRIIMANNPQAGLGILKECESKTFNCFSTTYNEIEVGVHDLKPWRFSGKSPMQALQEVKEVLQAYPPGQGDIDGGGFQFEEEKQFEKNRYMQIIFETLKKGHRDDVEFAIKPETPPDAQEGELLMRSASRVGRYDFGVNAARLNYIGKQLMKKGGWQTFQIDGKSHPGYFSQNCAMGESRKAPFVTRERYEKECEGF